MNISIQSQIGNVSIDFYPTAAISTYIMYIRVFPCVEHDQVASIKSVSGIFESFSTSLLFHRHGAETFEAPL